MNSRKRLTGGGERKGVWAARRAASAVDPRGWSIVAQEEWERGRLGKARAALRRSSEAAPVRALAFVLRAEVGLKVDNRRAAVGGGYFDEATVAQAGLLAETGRQDEAVRVLQAALVVANTMVGTPLGVLLEQLGRPDKAAAVYRTASDMGDGQPGEATRWARVAARSGDRPARRWLRSLASRPRRVSGP